MKDNYFDEMTFKLEFTPEEVTKLVYSVIFAQVDAESFIKNYPDDKELIGELKKEIDIYHSILDKLRKAK